MAQEQVVSLAPPSGEWVSAQASGGMPQDAIDGSVDDHHLDDLPGQAQIQHAVDLPALIMARLALIVPGATMFKPIPYVMVARLSPFLDGLQRPPCA